MAGGAVSVSFVSGEQPASSRRATPAGEDWRPVMSECQNGSRMEEQILWTESLEIQTLAKQLAEGVLELTAR